MRMTRDDVPEYPEPSRKPLAVCVVHDCAVVGSACFGTSGDGRLLADSHSLQTVQLTLE